ncbi:MAG: hypothetical protein JXA68_00145, partial [Ignavibacteriales bacterium]|nr:hypothetical protein [Ignavibacteriales bacterium]
IEKDMWGKRFPVYFRWKEQWYHRYQKTGYIDSLTGFRYSGVMSKNDCINYPIQGSAFHCLLWSLVHLDQYLYNHGYDSRIVGQIHDSIVLDIHPDELEDVVRLIRKITTDELLSNWKWIIVPLEVEFEICDVDASWADKKELNFFLNILGL